MALSSVKKFFINMVLGGFVIAMSALITENVSTTLGGVLYGSLPLGAFYLYLYVYFIYGSRSSNIQFINGSVMGGILWVIMVCLLYINPNRPISSVVYSILFYLILFGVIMMMANGRKNHVIAPILPKFR